MKSGGENMTPNSPPALRRRKFFMYDMQKLAMDVEFTYMTAKKGIKNDGERAVVAVYK